MFIKGWPHTIAAAGRTAEVSWRKEWRGSTHPFTSACLKRRNWLDGAFRAKLQVEAQGLLQFEARGLPANPFGTTIALDTSIYGLKRAASWAHRSERRSKAPRLSKTQFVAPTPPYQGELKVLGRTPLTERDQLISRMVCVQALSLSPCCPPAGYEFRSSHYFCCCGLANPRFDRAQIRRISGEDPPSIAPQGRELSKAWWPNCTSAGYGH